MKSIFLPLILCVLVWLSACQPSDKPTEDSSATIEMPENVFVRTNGESAADFTKRVWQQECPSVGGNAALTINDEVYLISHCGSEGNYQYLLLQADQAQANHYQRISSQKRTGDPTEEYYGFPNFIGPTYSVIDIDQDGKQELLVEIQVTGKSSGAGAEEESFWDESFFEVYELKEQQLAFSQTLTNAYFKKLNAQVDLVDPAEIQAKLVELTGAYITAVMIDGKLHWGPCDIYRIDVDKHNGEETTSIWKDEGMDGFPLRVNRISGDTETNTYTFFCHAPTFDGEGGFRPMDLTYRVADGVHYFELEEGEVYVLETDKDKISKSPDDCEYVDEGE